MLLGKSAGKSGRLPQHSEKREKAVAETVEAAHGIYEQFVTFRRNA